MFHRFFLCVFAFPKFFYLFSYLASSRFPKKRTKLSSSSSSGLTLRNEQHIFLPVSSRFHIASRRSVSTKSNTAEQPRKNYTSPVKMTYTNFLTRYSRPFRSSLPVLFEDIMHLSRLISCSIARSMASSPTFVFSHHEAVVSSLDSRA